MEKRITPSPQLIDILSPKATIKEFEATISELLSPKDKELLGEDALQKAAEGILLLVQFVPEPAMIDRGAHRAAVGFLDNTPLPSEEVDCLLRFAVEIGVLKEAPDGFYMVAANIHPTLRLIADQLE
jgi:hypothetical protein